jgi:hypothetical protein
MRGAERSIRTSPSTQSRKYGGALLGMLDSFSAISRHLSQRRHGRPTFRIGNKYDVQDLLYGCVRSVFRDARLEEWTPKHGGTSKRIDIVVPSAETVIETKIIRSVAHARTISDELKIDIESYHSHGNCKNLLVLVWDPKAQIKDPAPISDDLSGHRVKGNNVFDVTVAVRR